MSKTFKFVLNNWTEKEKEFFCNIDCTRIAFGEEVGDSGTPHLQGFVTFSRNYRITALKKLNNRCHWEIAKCLDWNYEIKELNNGGEVFIKDNRKSGHRTDLDDVVAAVKNGATVTELWEQHSKTMIRYHKGICEMKRVLNQRRVEIKFKLSDFSWEPINDWSKTQILWGLPGVGKTSFAIAHFENPLVVRHLDQLLQLSEEHDGIIFDDMDFRHLPRTTQIHLVDIELDSSIHCRYNCAVIPKNTKKIICTNELQGECIAIDDGAVKRRVTVTEVVKR